MGHTSTRVALVYQHATRDRDEAIAAGGGEVLAAVRREGTVRSRSGTTEGNGFLVAACGLGGTGLELWSLLERATGIEPA
jgi:hypothetical protein